MCGKNKKKRDVLFKIIATMLIAIIFIQVNINTVRAFSSGWTKEKELSIEEINEREKTENIETNIQEREIVGEDISERNSDNQLWKAIDNGDGTIRLINKEKGDNYCITLETDNAQNGTSIIISKWEGKSTQKLKLYDIDGNNTLLDEMVLESGEIYRIKAKIVDYI